MFGELLKCHVTRSRRNGIHHGEGRVVEGDRTRVDVHLEVVGVRGARDEEDVRGVVEQPSQADLRRVAAQGPRRGQDRRLVG
jgi:hypothetical protein